MPDAREVVYAAAQEHLERLDQTIVVKKLRSHPVSSDFVADADELRRALTVDCKQHRCHLPVPEPTP